MKRKMLLIITTILTACIVLGSCVARVDATPNNRQVILIAIDGLSFSDLEKWRSYPQMQKWLSTAAYGALTVRTPGPRSAENAFLQMGSGGQALYTPRSGTAYSHWERLGSGETALERSRQWGVAVTAEAAIYFPGMYRLLGENAGKPYTQQIGLLGSTLARNGLRVAVYGNDDYGSTTHRPAVLMAMDQRGTVPGGDVSARTNVKAADYPYGIRSNYEFFASMLQQEKAPGLTVVELSDLARLYRQREFMSEQRFTRQYDRVLADLDRFLGTVLQAKRANQFIMVVSPAVNPAAQANKSLLLPIMQWRSTDSGGLFSLTTRQAGLVNGLDILPTIFAWLSLPMPEKAVGHVIKVAKQDPLSLPGLLSKVQQIDRIYQNRSPVLYTYALIHIAVLLLALAAWLWQKRQSSAGFSSIQRVIRVMLLSMLLYPVLFLVEPLLKWQVPPAIVIGMVVITALTVAVATERSGFVRLLLGVSALTVAGLLLDGFGGGVMLSRSYLGYDPVIGARFYGLGNEYEGVLIGASILFVAALHDWWHARSLPTVWCRLLAVAVLGVVLLYLALPSLGADAGGFLAGIFGFGIAIARLWGWAVGKRGIFMSVGVLAGGLAVLIAVNGLSAQPLTHVGVVAQQILSGDWTEVGHMLQRKAEMNLRLIRVSAWGKVFAVALVTICILTLRSERFMQRLASRYPHTVKGFAGIAAASLAGLVLNDSGIITAATSILFLVIPALYAALCTEAIKADRST